MKGATEIAQPFFRPGHGWAPGRAVASTAGSLYLPPGTAAAFSGCSARIAAARCCRFVGCVPGWVFMGFVAGELGG